MRRLLPWLCVLFLSACGSYGGRVAQSTEATPHVAEAGAVGSEAEHIRRVDDPLAPGWSVHEERLDDDRRHLSLKLDWFHIGGDGDARAIVARRASALVREGGYAGYELLRFEEGLKSGVLRVNRFAEAEIRLYRSAALEAF